MSELLIACGFLGIGFFFVLFNVRLLRIIDVLEEMRKDTDSHLDRICLEVLNIKAEMQRTRSAPASDGAQRAVGQPEAGTATDTDRRATGPG